MVIFMVMIRRFRLSGRLSVTLCLAMLGATGSASAQDDRHGFYVGIETGVSIASTVTFSLSGVNHPTRCDRLLYPASVSPPTSDPATRPASTTSRSSSRPTSSKRAPGS